MTSLEAAASSRTACRSSFILNSSRSTASLEDLPNMPNDDLGDGDMAAWPPKDGEAGLAGVVNPAELMDFLSLRDLRILVNA